MVGIAFFELPQLAATTSKPAVRAMRIHLAVVTLSRRPDIPFSNKRSKKRTAANAKPSDPVRDVGPATTRPGVAP
jgi:hypothetical protein